MCNKKGFTLIEIIVVLVIIALLAAVAIPNYTSMMVQGATKAAQNNLVSIYNAQQNYYFTNGSYCIAGCDNLADLNRPTNLNLNITDNNFRYSCGLLVGAGFQCTAQNFSQDTKLSLTVTSVQPVPSCLSDVPAYCPN